MRRYSNNIALRIYLRTVYQQKDFAICIVVDKWHYYFDFFFHLRSAAKQMGKVGIAIWQGVQILVCFRTPGFLIYCLFLIFVHLRRTANP